MSSPTHEQIHRIYLHPPVLHKNQPLPQLPPPAGRLRHIASMANMAARTISALVTAAMEKLKQSPQLEDFEEQASWGQLANGGCSWRIHNWCREWELCHHLKCNWRQLSLETFTSPLQMGNYALCLGTLTLQWVFRHFVGLTGYVLSRANLVWASSHGRDWDEPINRMCMKLDMCF